MKYRKKPVEVEAVQWTLENAREVIRFLGCVEFQDEIIEISTPEGKIYGNLGDWIVRGIQGEYYPVKPDIFEATYEPVKGED